MTLRRDQINRHRERARDERAELDAVLDAGHHVGTLSTVADGRPWVVPMLYGRAGDRILMHGSVGAGALRYVATGAPAALCVMHVDGWVYAHTLSTRAPTTAPPSYTVSCARSAGTRRPRR
jgi:nitroimidazol reductase NimA-like FMN-containing flavoprotein (pyridoxamine 5'-phosphate oxidase superfamily)